MDVKQCYEKIGGNYDDVMSRLRTDERIKKFLLKVADDKSFELLCSSLETRNIEEAFRAAHTIKGVCLKLSITRLYNSASALTEALRGKTEFDPEFDRLLERVRADYEVTVAGIREIV